MRSGATYYQRLLGVQSPSTSWCIFGASECGKNHTVCSAKQVFSSHLKSCLSQVQNVWSFLSCPGPLEVKAEQITKRSMISGSLPDYLPTDKSLLSFPPGSAKITKAKIIDKLCHFSSESLPHFFHGHHLPSFLCSHPWFILFPESWHLAEWPWWIWKYRHLKKLQLGGLKDKSNEAYLCSDLLLPFLMAGTCVWLLLEMCRLIGSVHMSSNEQMTSENLSKTYFIIKITNMNILLINKKIR